MQRTTRGVGLLIAFVLMACRSEQPSNVGEDNKPDAQPLAGMPELDPPDGNFSGVVAERLDAGGYTYLRVDDTWVVTLGGGQAVGATVDVVSMGVRSDFRSRRLDRTFSHLVFGIVRHRS